MGLEYPIFSCDVHHDLGSFKSRRSASGRDYHVWVSEKKDSPQPGRMTRIGHVCAAHRSLLAVVAAIVGAIVGAAAVLFNAMIGAWTWVTTGYWDYTQHIGSSHGRLPIPAWVFLLFAPVISALIYGPLISRFAPSAKGHGIPEVMLAVQQKADISLPKSLSSNSFLLPSPSAAEDQLGVKAQSFKLVPH